MKLIEIVCPDCGKLIIKVSVDSVVTLFGWCRRCREEKKIKYRAEEPPKK